MSTETHGGFEERDRVMCASGKVAIITKLRDDGKLDAHYEGNSRNRTILDPDDVELWFG